MSELSKLKWRCRRGMKELDLLLNSYLDQHYATATAAEQQQFQQLLEQPDPELHAYLVGRKTADDPELAALIVKMQSLVLPT